MEPTKLPAVVVAAMLVLTAVASVPVAAAEESVAVETQYADEVTEDSASLHGNLTELENASEATVWFEYWVEGDEANATNTTMETVTEVGPFHGYPEGLANNTTYVFVAHAETGNASAVGDVDTFTTDDASGVAVETEDADDVTNESATLRGELTDLQGAENATVWFEYWVEGDEANASTTADQTLDEPGAFGASVDDLEPETSYVVVAHAAADGESAAGDEVGFETASDEPDERPLDVETGEASEVTNTSATLEGELTGLGGEDTATVWFEYWVEGDRTDGSTTTTAAQTLDEAGAFDETVDGLENDTTYVYVAHARTNGGDVTGDEESFTTGDGSSGSVDDVPAWDGEGPFGQWLTSWLKNLLPADSDVPFGQLVSELVHANNPGSEHRSDKANPGGNGNGPSDHAKGPKDTADEADDEEDGDDEEQ